MRSRQKVHEVSRHVVGRTLQRSGEKGFGGSAKRGHVFVVDITTILLGNHDRATEKDEKLCAGWPKNQGKSGEYWEKITILRGFSIEEGTGLQRLGEV